MDSQQGTPPTEDQAPQPPPPPAARQPQHRVPFCQCVMCDDCNLCDDCRVSLNMGRGQ